MCKMNLSRKNYLNSIYPGLFYLLKGLLGEVKETQLHPLLSVILFINGLVLT